MIPTKDASSQQDWLGLELLKAFGVFVILFVHPHFLLISNKYRIVNPESKIVELTETLMIFGSFICLLPILAGCSLRVGMWNQGGHGKKSLLFGTPIPAGFVQRTAWTGIVIALLGFSMNALTWGNWYLFSWNMLQMIAVGLTLTAILIATVGRHGPLVVGLAVLFIAEPIANHVAEFNESYVVGVLAGNHSQFIFWPLLPWIALPMLGYWVADFLASKQGKYIREAGLFIIGLTLILIAWLSGEMFAELNHDYVWTQLMIQPSIFEVLGSLGIFLSLLIVAQKTVQNLLPGKAFSRYGIINCYSKGILWIYLFQMIISYKLSPWIISMLNFRSHMEMDTMISVVAYAVFPLLMMALGWGIGFVSIKLIQENRIRITLRKAGAGEYTPRNA